MKRSFFLMLLMLCTAVLALAPAGAASAQDSGTIGTLSWSLDDRGLLTISGSGAMWDFSYQTVDGQSCTSAPWGSAPTALVLGGGVSSIGKYAFYGCRSLVQVTFGGGLQSIGDYAFSRCASLTQLQLPDGLTTLGGYVFSRSDQLALVSVPDSAVNLSSGAFGNFSGVVQCGADSAAAHFLGSRKLGFREPDSGCLLRWLYQGSAETGLALIRANEEAAELALPDGVTAIAASAFDGCGQLKRLTLPESLTGIDPDAGIPENVVIAVPVCGSFAHQWAMDSGRPCDVLSHQRPVQSPPAAPTWSRSGLSGGSSCAVCGQVLEAQQVIPALSELEVLELPADLKVIGSGAFTGGSFQAALIPDGCGAIGSQAFSNCESLIYVRIPATVTEEAADAFSGSSPLLIDRAR